VSRPDLNEREDQKLGTHLFPLDFWCHGSLPHMAYPYNDDARHQSQLRATRLSIETR
jgi:hypothetical protein